MVSRKVLKKLRLELPIADDMEIAAAEAATSIGESVAMSQDKLDEVRMALIEACINAFEHSHAEDGKVYVTFAVLGEVEPTALRITVQDFGHGFDASAVVRPSPPGSGGRKRGHGLTLIRGLMDEVDIRSGGAGTTVVMSKVL